MNLLVTFPGKHGDLLWALPTIRAIKYRYPDARIHLRIAAPFVTLVPLLQVQPYLSTVNAWIEWQTEDTAPISPRVPPSTLSGRAGLNNDERAYDRIIHLGYREWPTPDLVRHTWDTYNMQAAPGESLYIEELRLHEPWITLPPDLAAPANSRVTSWLCGFTDEFFELKFGLWSLLNGAGEGGCRNFSQGPRWKTEGGIPALPWLALAQWMAQTKAVLADCSAMHVLAAAMGIPVVLVEPQEMRWNPVFYPLGNAGAVRVVTGGDGRPTFDARHVRDVLTDTLRTLSPRTQPT